MLFRRPSVSFNAACLLIWGKSTVVMDAEKIPNGSCQNTRAFDMAEALPSSRPEANRKATCSVMMNMEDVATSGSHCLMIRLKRSVLKEKLGENHNRAFDTGDLKDNLCDTTNDHPNRHGIYAKLLSKPEDESNHRFGKENRRKGR